jgi:hypothetical protein
MSTPHRSMSIRDRLADAPDAGNRYLWGATESVCLGDLVSGTTLGGRASELAADRLRSPRAISMPRRWR